LTLTLSTKASPIGRLLRVCDSAGPIIACAPVNVHPIERAVDPGFLRISPQMIFARQILANAGCPAMSISLPLCPTPAVFP